MFRRRLYSGYSMEEFNQIRDALDREKVPYRYKTHSRTGQWAGAGTIRGRTGGAFLSTKYDLLYEILVKKEDLAAAGRILREVKK